MKRVLFVIFVFIMPLACSAAEFIHPASFSGSEKEKKQVIEYIKENVNREYSAIGMGNPSTLRMMENQELKSFKQLTKVTDASLLDRVIDQYCGIGMCNYQTLLMMYNQEKKAASQSLTW
ncbi:hypothetical protein [Desulfoluna butyratoxydans]|uniref:Uncharacterized protein n=1 Tax=Desulfoluna butyratoxydans TaxID=231438 RepID=A0A4U8YM20_9BACT|nr:hypothetical protein [Desulfoluna butyratoxydans]VFQ44781.1 hypothetical protein MSL71_24380 [Desulfoluna butyratoxydans]